MPKGKTAAGIWNTNSFKVEDVMADGRAEEKDGIHRAALFATIMTHVS